MKLRMFPCVALACCASAIVVQAYAQTAAGVPHLEKQGTATQLIVDGKPFLALTGELGNNTSARAYRALMRYIKEVDSQQHTVLMMQVENEVGVLRDSRDRSEPANRSEEHTSELQSPC